MTKDRNRNTELAQDGGVKSGVGPGLHKTSRKTKTGPDAAFRSLVESVSKRLLGATKKGHTHWVAVKPRDVAWSVCVQVPTAKKAAFLNDLGDAMVAAGQWNAQTVPQKRTSSESSDIEQIDGVIIEWDDTKPANLLGVITTAGIPIPTVLFESTGGFKIEYIFLRPVSREQAIRFSTWVGISIPGCDPASWRTSQFQFLPRAIKEKDGDRVDVDFKAIQLNPAPLDLDEFHFDRLPPRLARLGGVIRGPLTVDERTRVEDYLAKRGTPAPATTGCARYAECPNRTRHSHRTDFAVYRKEDGSIDATCFGGHGQGERSYWSERDLLALADASDDGGGDRNHQTPAQGFDVVDDVSGTWIGIDFLKQLFKDGLANDADKADMIEGAISLWYYARASRDRVPLRNWAQREAEKLGTDDEVAGPSVDEIIAHMKSRIAPYVSRTSPKVYFDDLAISMHYFNKSGMSLPINTKETSLSARAMRFAHYWRASMGYQLVPKVAVKLDKKTGAFHISDEHYEGDNIDIFESHWNSALFGDPETLGALGFGRIVSHDYPACFVDNRYRFDPVTNCISQSRFPELKPGDDHFNVFGFFEKLFNDGRLPLASLNDVRKVIMAVASPLVRNIGAGLMGLYWATGASGSGKEFIIMLICLIWEACLKTPPRSRVFFEIRDVGDLEMQKALFAARGACFAWGKESGKSTEKIISLIRLSGAATVTKRNHYQLEVVSPNYYVYFADSAENLPEKREIARRTVEIHVAHVDKSINLRETLDAILEKAPDIIRSLQRIIEEQGPEYFLNQSNCDSRPVVPVALARLFHVELDEVTGRDFSQLFRAMLEYKQESGVKEIGESERDHVTRSSPNGSKAGHLFPSYPFGHFVETMSGYRRENENLIPRGYRLLLKEFDSPKRLRMALDTEMGYSGRINKKMKYLPIRVDGKRYAFRFVGTDNQNFILEPEDVFCHTLGIPPITEGAAEANARIAQLEKELVDKLVEWDAERAAADQALSEEYGSVDPEDRKALAEISKRRESLAQEFAARRDKLREQYNVEIGECACEKA